MSHTPERLPQWQELAEHQRAMAGVSIGDLFAADPQRARAMTFEAGGLRVDLSRHRANAQTMTLLAQLARAMDLEGWRARLLAGEAVNNTEQRAATHIALRAQPAADAPFLQLAEALRARQIHGASGAMIDTVVCLGIGGSDLGPRLVTQALGAHTGPELHFVTNIDPVELAAALAHSVPARTLIVAISKSFTTLETLENLRAALAWLRAGGIADLSPHVVAVTSRPERVRAFARDEGYTPRDETMLTFDETIGGRYSLWSACGLPIAIAHGATRFRQLLAGAAAMDAHFAAQPIERNVPVVLALLQVWYTNFWNARTRAVMAYAQRLEALAPYLQQLEMESNGKRVDRDGAPLAYDTVPVVWGGVGTTAQHSVFQFLHQGTHFSPVDFVTSARFASSVERRERLLHMNAVAQADALAFGDAATGDRAKPAFAAVPGNRPSSFIELADIDAPSLGALLALYEHRTFACSVLWNINAFDQWGVEIGKKLLAQRLHKDGA
jgi:glucose-6-phosphate isomerase